jgi:hypothetical protein
VGTQSLGEPLEQIATGMGVTIADPTENIAPRFFASRSVHFNVPHPVPIGQSGH